MKHFTVLLVVLMSITSTKAMAYDIAVANDDGVTIYYNYINNGTELEVTASDLLYELGQDRTKCYYSIGYRGVEKLRIPSEVTYMGKKKKVTAIGDHAFANVESYYTSNMDNNTFTDIYLPLSLNKISSTAFVLYHGNVRNEFRLWQYPIKIHIEDLKQWFEIDMTRDWLSYELFLNDIAILDLVIPDGITKLEEGLFRNCQSITSVTIGNGVLEMGSRAFQQCLSLKSVTIGNGVSEIKDATFLNCENLLSVTIGNSVRSIGNSAFALCIRISSLTIGQSVERIDARAFDLGNKETSIISLIEAPKDIDEAAFNIFFQNSVKLYVPNGTIEKYKACKGWRNFENIEEIGVTGISYIERAKQTGLRRYALNGQRANLQTKGLNIIKMENGTTHKVVVK